MFSSSLVSSRAVKIEKTNGIRKCPRAPAGPARMLCPVWHILAEVAPREDAECAFQGWLVTNIWSNTKKQGIFKAALTIFSVKTTLRRIQVQIPKTILPEFRGKTCHRDIHPNSNMSLTISFQYLCKNIQWGFFPILDGFSPPVNALLPHTSQQPHTLLGLLYQFLLPWHELNTEFPESFYSFCW